MTSEKKRFRADIPLIFILLLSAFLNIYNIWTDEYANTYYTTAVASMLENFHNFFFASLDSAGSVTVDKPPVTFWIQTISAYVFGLHGWSVILPQALAGIGSVLLMYRLVKPTFGLAAARISALAMASTPIAVAVSRTNNIDSMLVFTLLLAATLLFRAIKRNSIWSLLGAFAVIGVAFNMKMMQAYMVLPAFYLFYIVAVKLSWKKKIAQLASATAIMLVISLSWAVVVDSIPADQRPYIGSSQNNSVLELALGYNGISRLTGNKNPGGGMPDGGFARNQDAGAMNQDDGSGKANMDGSGAVQSNGTNGSVQSNGSTDGAPVAFQDDGTMQGFGQGQGQGQSTGTGSDGRQGSRDGFGAGGAPGGGMGGAFGTGEKGPLRLFQSALSGQASWLIPFAFISCIGLFAGWRRKRFTQKQKETLFWLAWLVPGMVFFSIAGFFHHYYLIMLAPPIAALVGAGWSRLWALYRNRSGWASWLLPAAILATSAFEWYIVHPYDDTIGSGWSIGIAAGGVLIAVLLAVMKQREQRFVHTIALAGLLLLFVGPLYWAATPITYGLNSMIPQAGPGSANGMGGMGPGMNIGMNPGSMNFDANADMNRSNNSDTNSGINSDGNINGNPGANRDGKTDDNAAAKSRDGAGKGSSQNLDEKTLTYLRQNNTGEKYLFAAMDYNTAAPYMVKGGESVVILNGFSGSDKVYTVEKLKELVEKGEVKYFMISGGGMGGGRGGNSELTQWITEHGKVIPSEEWQSTGSSGNSGNSGFMQGGFGGGMTLYEVKL